MKKYILLVFLWFFTLNLKSQNNLVQNYSFENVTGTLECIVGPTPSYPNWITHDQEALEDYWSQLPPWTVPEMGIIAIGAGSSDHLCDGGNTGDNYGRMLNREYICAPLAGGGLVSGQRYYIEFYIKATSSLSDVGLKFSTARPKQVGYLKINIDGDPSFEVDNNVVFNYVTWTKVSGFYTADNNYTWITLGSFNKEKEDQSTFAIDDIKIIEWVPQCPTVQLLENWDYTGFQGILLSAGDYLHAGFNVGSPRTNGNVIVQVGSEVSFKAENEVGLFDGFVAADGAEFHAYNAPCGSECFPPSPVAGIAADICDDTPYEIGEPAGFNETYLWTSNPSNAINNLSSTTISNPAFTPPSSGSGTISYTVTATNACGQTGSNSISIHYENNPSSTAQLSLSNITLGDLPSFDVNYDSHVKSVMIEVLDVSLATTYYSSTFFDAIDFSCCSFPWELPVSLSPCLDYKIRVTATNYCTGATTSQIIDWTRNRSVTLTALLPNVITPNGDGINDQFCFQFTGASSYTLIINSPSGQPVFVASNVTAYPVSVCAWAGECNASACSGDNVGDGVYFFTLTLFNCNGQEAFSTSGFLEVLNGGGRLANPYDSTLFVEEGINAISVFPNPTNDGNVIIDFGNQQCRQVEIYNSIGQVMDVRMKPSADKNQMLLEGMNAGMYYVRILLANGEYEVKQVIVL